MFCELRRRGDRCDDVDQSAGRITENEVPLPEVLTAQREHRFQSCLCDADPWTQLMVGSRTFLAASTEPAVQQIMLIDAPAVLGWGVWRELDAGTSRQHL